MNKKKLILTVTVLTALVAAGCVSGTTPSQTPGPTPEAQITNPQPATSQPSSSQPNSPQFSTPKKSAHYEGNIPEHGSVLAAPPVNIVIDFNFDLATPSDISIIKDDKEYSTGNTTIDKNKLAMRKNFDPNAPDGMYKVSYKACWPDGSCHNGYFEFALDKTKGANFEDLQGKKEVTIKLSDIEFKPKNIKISSGTKVTWINDENVEHYVNSDSHPAHTYYPEQNSRILKQGDTYSFTFTTPGIYPYHCSAHADSMKADIIVL